MDHTYLFVTAGNDAVPPGFGGGAANVPDCRIPALISATRLGIEQVCAVCDSANAGADWGMIGLARRVSADSGVTFGEAADMLRLPVRRAPRSFGEYTAAFAIDPVLTAADNGRLICVFDMFPECKGMHAPMLLTSKAFDDSAAGGMIVYPGRKNRVCVLRSDGFVYEGTERTRYYTPLRHDPRTAFVTLGDLYYMTGDEPQYARSFPPLSPALPGVKDDIYCGNIYLDGSRSKFPSGKPKPVKKRPAGRAEGLAFECLETEPAPYTVPASQHLFMMISEDLGDTWSQPVDITPSVKRSGDGLFLGTAPGRGICLRYQKDERLNGRVLVPVYRPGRSAVIISDDCGVHWRRGKMLYSKNIDESELAELPDGRIFCFGRQKRPGGTPVSVSEDGGETWSRCPETGLMSVKCQKSVMALPSGLLLASCPTGRSRSHGMVSVGRVSGEQIKWKEYLDVDTAAENADLLCDKRFFAYSCLSALPDGRTGLLCETAPAGLIEFIAFPTPPCACGIEQKGGASGPTEK